MNNSTTLFWNTTEDRDEMENMVNTILLSDGLQRPSWMDRVLGGVTCFKDPAGFRVRNVGWFVQLSQQGSFP